MTNTLPRDDAPTLQRAIRRKDLPAFIGLRRTAIEELIATDPTFPRPHKISARAVVFWEHEIVAWQQSKIAERDALLTKRGGKR